MESNIKLIISEMMKMVDKDLDYYDGKDTSYIICDIKLNPKKYDQKDFMIYVYPIIKEGMTNKELEEAKEVCLSIYRSIMIYVKTFKTSHPKRPLTASVFEYLETVGYTNFECVTNGFRY